MRRVQLMKGIFTAVVLTLAGLWFWPSEKAQIRHHVEDLADALAFNGNAELPGKSAQLRAQVRSLVELPLTVDIAEFGERKEPLESLIAEYFAYCNRLSALQVVLQNIQVDVASSGLAATVKAEALVRTVNDTLQQRTEPRRISVTLLKRENRWRVVHVKATEPRFDQPEARP